MLSAANVSFNLSRSLESLNKNLQCLSKLFPSPPSFLLLVLLIGRSKFPMDPSHPQSCSASSHVSSSQFLVSMKTLWGAVLMLNCDWLLGHGMLYIQWSPVNLKVYIMCHELLPQFLQIKPRELMR